MNHLKRSMLVCMFAFVLTTLVTAGVVQAAGLTSGKWSIVPSPNPGSRYNELRGVAAISATDIWAVGFYSNNLGTGQTLIKHWDGTNWLVIPSPNVAGSSANDLQGVAAISANDIWAVGLAQSDDTDQTLIEHWDGISWQVVPSSKLGSGSNLLRGVAAVSANDIWAVGLFQKNNATLRKALIEHWDGTTWQVVPSPKVGSSTNWLLGVAAVSTNDIWAAGFYYNSSGPQRTLIEHWNGTSWQVHFSPNIGPSDQLEGVAAISANDIWAVGKHAIDFTSNYKTLIEHGSGSLG